MFHPTSRNLLHLSTPWSFLKIHQPLPLSSRASQQLLELLTTSFRQQLDQEHGTVPPNISSHETGSPSMSWKRKGSNSPSTQRPADSHLNSILTNPLFVHPPSKSTCMANESRKTPMDVFDEACARGLMTLDHAYGCLYAHKRDLRLSSNASISQSMRDSEAGSKVLSWLLSNGHVNATLFLDYPKFTALLIEYLVAESSTHIVWHWLTNAFDNCVKSQAGPQRKTSLQLATYLLDTLIKAQTTCHLTLDKSYMIFNKSVEYLQSIAGTDALKPHDSLASVLRRAGYRLSYESTVKAFAHLPAMPKNYDLFSKHLPLYTINPQHHAHLALHHPTRRNTQPALKLLRLRQDTLQHLTSPSVTVKSTDMRNIAIGLDTAKILLEQGKSSDAKWIMNFLSETYPAHLGINASLSRDLAMARAEADTLECLKGLDLAF